MAVDVDSLLWPSSGSVSRTHTCFGFRPWVQSSAVAIKFCGHS